MQFAKDSFFLALQQRLAALNPVRTVTISGTTVPAILVTENLAPASAEPEPNTYYIEWGSAEVLRGHADSAALISLDVVISYYSVGSVASMVDRGRLLAQLDEELLAICQPPNTEKRDYTRSPSMDLGTSVFWTQPSLGDRKHSGGASSAGNVNGSGTTKDHQDARVEREARLMMHFFSEVTLS